MASHSVVHPVLEDSSGFSNIIHELTERCPLSAWPRLVCGLCCELEVSGLLEALGYFDWKEIAWDFCRPNSSEALANLGKEIDALANVLAKETPDVVGTRRFQELKRGAAWCKLVSDAGFGCAYARRDDCCVRL